MTVSVNNNLLQGDQSRIIGDYTPLDSLPLPVELDLAGFVLGSDGAFYGNQSVPFSSELVRITSDADRTVLAEGDWFPSVVGNDGALYGWGGLSCVGYATVCGASLFRST